MRAHRMPGRVEAIDKPRSLINRRAQSFAKPPILVISGHMSAERINEAMARINAAMARIDAARLDMKASAKSSNDSGQSKEGPGSARVMALVNAHEKLREEVADTLGELDTLIEELESE